MKRRVVTTDDGGIVVTDPRRWDYFVKRPVVIRAVQIMEPFSVETLEGTMRGEAGHWLIEGIAGELYPCKDSIFQKTYRLITEEEADALREAE